VKYIRPLITSKANVQVSDPKISFGSVPIRPASKIVRERNSK
jgi:hypothetical protein